MNIEEWLTQYAYRYADLSMIDRKMIEQFSLLWSFFEYRVLGASANVPKIMKKVHELDRASAIANDCSSSALEYFRDRYSTGGDTNQKFDALRFGNADRKRLVQDVITSRKSDAVSVVQSLLIISYRLRNNLFHGEKWAYGLQDQCDNFRNASTVLIEVMNLQHS